MITAKRKVGRPSNADRAQQRIALAKQRLEIKKEEQRKENVKKRFLVIVKSDVTKALIERRQIQNNIGPFIKKVFSTVDPGAVYKHNWHIDYIAEYLQAAWLKQFRGLIFNIPPRFMKSICVTIAFPAWGLGKKPSEQFICASYSGKLALKHSLYGRRVMESEWYRAAFPETIIRADQNEKSQYMTTEMGYRVATSVGATATGDGGNFKILDDAVNPKEALSDPMRLEANTWIDQTWSTRGNDPKTTTDIIVGQRLHTDDPTGHALDKGGYEHVIVPQEAETRTIVIFPLSKKKIVREEGDLLHEERFGTAEVSKAKADLGTYGYAGQQQQSPIPKEGGRIDLSKIPRYKQRPVEFSSVVFSLDTAQKDKEINDPSVCSVFGKVKNRWYWVDLWKERAKYPLLKKTVISMANTWHPNAVLIEDKSSGTSLLQDLQDDTSIPVVAIEPEADKITRMDTQTPSLEAGLIVLPDPQYNRDAIWLMYLERCLQTFPAPPSWDEIDTLSQFIKWTQAKTVKLEVW